MDLQLDLLPPPRPAPPEGDPFDVLTRAVVARGTGITLRQIGTAGALARELERDAPDVERLEWMARRLGLRAADLPPTQDRPTTDR